MRLAAGAFIGLTVISPVLSAASTPTGGAFVSGFGNISSPGNTLTVNQNTLRGIINWDSFSLSQSSAANFKNGTGSTLNRVMGRVPSRPDPGYRN